MKLTDLPHDALACIMRKVAAEVRQTITELVDEDGYAVNVTARRLKIDHLLSLATVSKAFAATIIDVNLWQWLGEDLVSSDLPRPDQLGSRWNSILNQTLCPYTFISLRVVPVAEGLQTARESLRYGRTTFELELVGKINDCTIHEAWEQVGSAICTDCTAISTRGIAVESFLAVSPLGFENMLAFDWPKLRALYLGHMQSMCASLLYDPPPRIVTLGARLKDGTVAQQPPFPALETVEAIGGTIGAHSKEIAGYAPNVRRVVLDNRPLGLLDDRRMEEVPDCHKGFMEAVEEFRVYIMPTCILGYRRPGPSKFDEDWLCYDQDMQTPYLNFDVFVLERRGTKVFRARYTAQELISAEDLQDISLVEDSKYWDI